MDTNTDIARELLLNNAGIAVHNGDSEELISSLLTLNNDKTTLRSMSKNMSNKVSKTIVEIFKFKNTLNYSKEYWRNKSV